MLTTLKTRASVSGGLLVLAVICLMTTSTQAANVTGDPATDGWHNHGHSLQKGTYVDGEENVGFDVYTTQFTVSDSGTFDLSGHDDSEYDDYYSDSEWTRASARSWDEGDTVIGVGGVFRDIDESEAEWEISGKSQNSTIDGENRLRLQAKIGSSNATWSQSNDAPDGGNGSSSTGDGGDGAFLVRTSGWHDLDVWEDFEGSILGLQNEDHISGYTDHTEVDTARVIWTWDDVAQRPASWELLVNTSLLAEDYEDAGFEDALPLPGMLNDPIIGSVQVENDDFTNGLATIVPEPATMSLLALGGLGALLKRKRQ